ncbi:major facilitator superfamily domain-containing protein [Linnemannia elongata]|nr:major facilitator superfamily domain-containing protein [Linnemannia elongata]
MDDSHLHASSSASNGQHPQEADNNNDTNTENSNTSHNSTLNNNKSNTRRLKNGTSLGRLHTQGLSSLRPGGSLAPPPAAAAAAGGSSGEYLRADGHVVNPNKLRPTTSALTTSICSTIEPSDCAAFNWVTRIIYRHYSRVDYVRTEAQLDREAYLIGNIRFSRWIFLPAAFCFQAVCGTLYAWSVFNNLIDTALYGPATNTHLAAITFYVALGCFGVSSSIMGPWLERNGPRKAGLLGAVLFLIGNLITALGVHVKMIALVYVGYGIFGGLGLGISYISPVSALQKWFPDRRGVAAGLAVSGFGAGSIVMAKIPDPLAAAVGLPFTFVILGSFYFVVMVVCAFVFRVPPPGYVVNGLDVWAVRVDDYDEDECFETRTHTEAEIRELGLKSISIEHTTLSAGSGLFSNNNNGTGAGVGSANFQSLHPLQQAHFGPRKSLDDSMSPISPISGTATMIPSAAISMTSRRNSTRCGARTGYDPSMSISLMDAFYSREFRLMYIMFLGNTMAGVVIISRLANIATDIFDHNKDAASTIVSINGGFNLVGRLFFASLSDRIGRKNSYMIMLGSQAIILACLPTIMQNRCNWAFLMSIWILTSCYGGGFGCIPAFLCDMFGPSNIGPLHGVILTSWSLSSVGAGLLFTAIYNHLLDTGYTVHDSYIYSINMNWILAGVALGLFMALFVRTGIRDRLLPAVPGEFFHSRIFGRILRFGRFGLKWVTKEQEESEWAAYVVKRQLEEEQDHGLSSSPGYHKTIDREEKASR